MMKRLTELLGWVLAFGVGLLVLACGTGSDGPTLQEYFDQWAVLDADTSEFDALAAEFPRAWEDPDDTRGYLRGLIPLTREGYARIDAFNVPAEVEEPHTEYLEAYEEAIGGFEALEDRLREVASEAELREFMASFELPGSERAEESCGELQEVADANGIEIDMDCYEK